MLTAMSSRLMSWFGKKAAAQPVKKEGQVIEAITKITTVVDMLNKKHEVLDKQCAKLLKEAKVSGVCMHAIIMLMKGLANLPIS